MLPLFLWPVIRRGGDMESLSQPPTPQGLSLVSRGTRRSSGPTPKDTTFSTCIRDSTFKTRRKQDPTSQTRAFLVRKHTAEEELAWNADDLGSRAGAGTRCGLRQLLVLTKPQVFICENRLLTPAS